MVVFILGLLVGAGLLWVVLYEERAELRALRAENAELTRAAGVQQWPHKSLLDDLDTITGARAPGIHSNQRH